MLLLTVISLYCLLGGVFACAFAARGYAAIAPGAKASIGARILWLPAATVLWPLLTVKWLRARGGESPAENSASISPSPSSPSPTPSPPSIP